LDAAHASDQVERVAIEAAIFEVSVIDVNGDDLSDDQAAAGGRGREIENLMELAFEADRRFFDASGTNELRGFGSDLGQFPFVDRRGVFAAGDVHGVEQRVGDDADDKFLGIANVAERVFWFALRRSL